MQPEFRWLAKPAGIRKETRQRGQQSPLLLTSYTQFGSEKSMITETTIRNLAEECLRERDSYLLEVKVKPGNVIQVIIDSDTLVGINDCVVLSRYLESNLDRETEDFELQVSSAGIDSPLRLPRQYRKNTGRDLDIELADEKLKATLLEAGDDHIRVQPLASKSKKVPVPEPRVLQYTEIKKAKIIIKF